MKQRFKTVKFRQDSLKLVDLCNQVITNYIAQNLRLTLRQLYYQLVVRNAIPNRERSYKNLSSLLSDARLAGLIDWDAIEDRLRQPRMPNEYRDLQQLVDAALYSYKLPRWRGQPNYVELWVEKDALAGVLAPLGRDYHVTVMVNRGYSSQSAMYESAKRFINEQEDGKTCYLFYLGDHDPSGEDMVRDIRDRFAMFGADVEVQKLALTMAQVRQYNPPPNPAKLSDPRAGDYVAQHGNESWEVDALPPEVLRQLIEEAIMGVRDPDILDEVIEQEDLDKKKLKKALAHVTKEDDEEEK